VLNTIISIWKKIENERTSLPPSSQKHDIQQIIAAYPLNVTQLKKKKVVNGTRQWFCLFFFNFLSFLMACSISSEIVRKSD